MGIGRFFTVKVVLLSGLSLLSWNCKKTQKSPQESDVVYYDMSDFKKTEKFDIHIHINTSQEQFIQEAIDNNFRFLDIIDDRPFGVPMEKQKEIAFQHLNSFPEKLEVATTFPVKDWGQTYWVDSTMARLDKSFQRGAIAVKIWKNIGMDLRDENGSFVMVSHPRIDSILNYLESKEIPLIGHNGEPRDCWLPLDEMTFSQGYYKSHPEYHMYLHPEYPSYDDQINAKDKMLGKHPGLKFMGAHLGSLEWSLDELAKRLDSFPNMSVDLTRIPYLKLHTFNDYDKTRDFFIKYQDRLIYGTDTAVNAMDSDSDSNIVEERWKSEWEFFATENPIPLEGYGTLKGLHLPKPVMDKIYLKNAMQFLHMENVE